jgi:hypothetical protein
MDPGASHSHGRHRRHRGPIPAGALAIAVGVVVGGASIAASFATDARDFAARAHPVLETCAL